MKILLISQYYPPEIGAASNRIGYFAQALKRAGHGVWVLTSTPNYPEGKVYGGYQNRFNLKEENGVNVARIKIFLSAKTNNFGRLAHYLSFVISAFISRKKIPRPDIIFASSPPLFVALLAVILKKLWKVPLVTDIRDLWPESVESVGAVKNKIFLRQAARLANYVYRSSDKITATSPGIHKNLPQHFQNKVIVLPNGAELDLFRPETSGSHVRREFSLVNKFVVLYTGNLGLAQAPEVFIKAAKILKNEIGIAFLIVGAGVLLPKLKDEAEKYGLSNIIFVGNRPRTEMPGFVAAANVCVIPYKSVNTFRNTFPSKMFDYMAGGKPILINLEGEASRLILKAKSGLVIKEEDSKDLANTILKLKNDPKLTEELGRNGRQFVEKNYTRKTAAKKLEDLLKHTLIG